MPITIEKLNGTTFKVTVTGCSTTTHTVTVSPEYKERLAPNTAAETLIEKSFEFLLEREPNTSVLRSFELGVIAGYFPEYEQTIRGLLK